MLDIDTCDACTAQALRLWTHKGLGLELCGHHSFKYELALISAGWELTPEVVVVPEEWSEMPAPETPIYNSMRQAWED